MRTKWLNLILKTSSRIQKIKDDLLVTHGIKSVVMVVWLILVALFFVIVSTPFTLLVKDDSNSLAVRKLLSLSFLLPITILWIVKLAFVVIFVFVLGYSWFNVTLKEDSDVVDTVRIHELKEDNSLEAPVDNNYSLTSFPAFQLKVFGKNEIENSDAILVSFSSPGDIYTRYLLEDLNEDGTWKVVKNFSIEEIPSGKYYLRFANVNLENNVQSQWSSATEVEIVKPVWLSVLQSLDLYLNILIIIFVGLSVFLTLIII